MSLSYEKGRTPHNKLSQDEAIRRMTERHDGFYTYERFVYINGTTKSWITCPIHGDFEQTYKMHVLGQGCKDCYEPHRGESCRSNKEEFVAKSQPMHNNKYGYDNVVYVNNSTEVWITCPIHGDFPQTPASHLTGAGCGRCKGLIKTTADFAKEGTIKHNGYYSYGRSVYVGAKKELWITCPVHGDFQQTPDSHLQGRGCRDCRTSGFKKNKDAWFYIINTKNFTGFGVTNDLKTRLKTHKRNLKKHGVDYKVFGTTFGIGSYILDMERAVTKEFRDQLIDTGIEGFKREAVKPEAFAPLLNFVERYANENRPEGRLDDT